VIKFSGVYDELGNLHGDVTFLNHRSGKFFLFSSSDDATVRCPRGHAAKRMNGLAKRKCTCDVCSKSIGREEPLYFTCFACNYDVCGTCCGAPLLGRLPPEQPLSLGSWAPLHFAVAAGHTEVAGALIEASADILAKDGAGRTPLHWASAAGLSPMVEMLLGRAKTKDVDITTAEDAYGFTPLRLAPPEMLRFASEDPEQIHGDAIEVGHPGNTPPGELAVAGIYTMQGQKDKRPLYKRSDGLGWAVCWDEQTSRWGLYREKYEAICIQYENRSNTPKCPVSGWVAVVAPDPSPSFEEVLPWRAGGALLAATDEELRPKPFELKTQASSLPALELPRGNADMVRVRRTESGGIQIALPGGELPPQEFFEQLVAEMIRRGDLPPEPPPGCVQQ